MSVLTWVRGYVRRHPRYAAGIVAGAMVMSGLVCLGVVTAVRHGDPETRTIGVPTHSAINADVASGPAALTMSRSMPTSVTIPSISVESRLLSLGQLPDGSVQVPLPGPDYGVAGWYRYSPTPGSMGPAVIVGHVDSAADGPSVFFRLGSLRSGGHRAGRQSRWNRGPLPGRLDRPLRQDAVPDQAGVRQHVLRGASTDHLRWAVRPSDRPLPRQHRRLRPPRASRLRATPPSVAHGSDAITETCRHAARCLRTGPDVTAPRYRPGHWRRRGRNPEVSHRPCWAGVPEILVGRICPQELSTVAIQQWFAGR